MYLAHKSEEIMVLLKKLIFKHIQGLSQGCIRLSVERSRRLCDARQEADPLYHNYAHKGHRFPQERLVLVRICGISILNSTSHCVYCEVFVQCKLHTVQYSVCT